MYNNFTNKVAYYKVVIENIYLKLYRTHVIYRNSIHKFSIGCNYINYTLEQFIKGIEKLNNLTKWNWFNAEVKKIEVGFNLRTERAKQFYSQFISFKSRNFEEVRTQDDYIVYGSICPFTEYDLILYDKQFQLLRQENKSIGYGLLRIELKIKDMSCIRNLKNPIKIYQVHDMVNLSIVKQLFVLLKNIIMNSKKDLEMDLSKFNEKELRIIATFENKKVFKQYEANNKRNADELRRKYFDLMKK